MNIQKTKEIEAFLARCYRNLKNDRKNSFLDREVTKGNEAYLQKQMKAQGFQEFKGSQETWPSLFLSVEDWKNSPYHSQIHLDHIQDAHFSYETEEILGNRLFNACAIQKDENRELNDWMMLRALDRNCESIYLYQDEEDWMMDSPSEALTNDPYARAAHGNVLTFGLGIGYFVFMAMRNPAVKSITVIEQSEEVISMFQKYLLPQFPSTVPLTIRQGDAFQSFHAQTFQDYDYVYSDIWQSSLDGLECMRKLLRNYLPSYESAAFWIEDSILEVVWTMVFLHMDELVHHKTIPVDPSYESIMKSIRVWFAKHPETITEVDSLKDILYDNRILREILHTDPNEKVPC